MSEGERIVSVYAIFSSDEEARRIGRHAIDNGLAACVNILGACHSIYRWQGRIEEAGEVPAIFKTSAATAARLIETISAMHSYEVSAAVVWPIELASDAYRDWVLDNSKGDVG